MKKWVISGITILLLCSVVVGICIIKNKNGTSSEDMIVGNRDKFATENGFFYVGGERHMTLHFYDFKSMEDVVLCNKPNCEHLEGTIEDPSTTCNAVYAGDRIVTAAIYHGKLYAILTSGIVYRSDIDGSNREEVIKLDSRVGGNAYFINNKIYYEGKIFEKDEKTSELTEIQEAFIGCIDLEKKTDNAITTKIKAYSAQAFMYGIYNDVIYYSISNYDHEYRENDKDNKMTIKYYQYNLKTKQESTLENGENMQKVKGAYACYVKDIDQEGTKTLNLVNLDNKKTELIYTGKELGIPRIFDDKIFYDLGTYDGKSVKFDKAKYYYFDPATGKTNEIPFKLEAASSIVITTETSDKFIVTISRNIVNGVSENLQAGWILKKDYYAGKIDIHTINLYPIQ